jgi:hypothetical protein
MGNELDGGELVEDFRKIETHHGSRGAAGHPKMENNWLNEAASVT